MRPPRRKLKKITRRRRLKPSKKSKLSRRRPKRKSEKRKLRSEPL